MSVIHIPRRHYTQPQGRVEVAPEWAARFSSAALHTQILPCDIVTGRPGSFFGNSNWPQLATTPHGLGVRASASANAIVPAYNIPEVIGDYTMIAVALAESYANSPTLLDTDDYPGARHCQFRFDTSGRIEHIAFNTSGQPFFSYSAQAVGGQAVCAAVVRKGPVIRSWLNGIPGNEVSISGTPQTSIARLTVGGSQSGSADDCTNGGASVLGWGVSPEALGDEELARITASPQAFWQLFRKDPLRIYSLPSGPISLSINSITASNITSSGARITLGLTR